MSAAHDLVLAACTDAQSAGYKLDLDSAAELSYLWQLGPTLGGVRGSTAALPAPLQGMPYVLALWFGDGIGPYIILSREAIIALRRDPQLADALSSAIRSAAHELPAHRDLWAVALSAERTPSGEIVAHESRYVITENV